MRDKLIEIIGNYDSEIDCDFYPKDQEGGRCGDECFADYLLSKNVFVPPSEHVYFIVDKGTKYAMAMPKRTDELQLYKLRDLEKYGYYLSKEEAERHL